MVYNSFSILAVNVSDQAAAGQNFITRDILDIIVSALKGIVKWRFSMQLIEKHEYCAGYIML